MSAPTLAEAILSHAAGRDLRAGELAVVPLDVVMVHDSIAPSAIRILHEELGAAHVWDAERVAVGIDHVAPAATVGVAENQKKLREWVKSQGLPHFFESGRGIAHQVLIEERLARPGRVMIGSDSHSTAYGAVCAFGTGKGATDIALALATGRTWMRVPETIRVACRGEFAEGTGPKDLALHLARVLGAAGATYMALEYHGLEEHSVGARTTIATMALEVGAKAGLVAPDGLPPDYTVPAWLRVAEGARYSRTVEVDLAALRPQVARPGRVDDVIDAEELGEVPVDVVYVGTCTNGRAEDMAAVARGLDGRPVAEGVRMIVVPASRQAFELAVADGTVATLLAAGATFGPPGCGACIGRHLGVLAAGETCLFTGNRNFVGRMGSPEARIFLGSPEVAAETAALGRISAPREPSSAQREVVLT